MTTVYAVKLCAPNDPSGNPRRGWVVQNAKGETLGWVEEGYRGNHIKRTLAPLNVLELMAVPTTFRGYNQARKLGDVEPQEVEDTCQRYVADVMNALTPVFALLNEDVGESEYMEAAEDAREGLNRALALLKDLRKGS